MLLDALEFGLRLRILGGVEPNVLPIARSNTGRQTGTDGVEHELGRVDVGRAVRAVVGKVLAEEVAVQPDVPEVYGLAATLEKQELVERLDEE